MQEQVIRLDGEKIRVLRAQLDITQADLGEKSGISQSHISRIEKGEIINVSLGIAERIHEGLGVEWPSLLKRVKRERRYVDLSDPKLRVYLDSIKNKRTSRKRLASELLDLARLVLEEEEADLAGEEPT